MNRRRRSLAILVLVGGLASGLTMAACSPEATRTRSGGPGGDIGNRPATVQIHGATNPYYETPRYGGATAR